METLKNYITVMRQADVTDLAASMSRADIKKGAALMKPGPDAFSVAESLSDAEIETLIRFFTLAEMQLSGWDGGQDSPVIPLVRILKARGAFKADLRRWIKANTDNRFLPYGAL
ncbi:MAG: hypothetical protein WD002_11925 [Pseudomonadales bacterium]